jgi:hypothetical protein
MTLKTLLALSAIALATPALAEDQTRQQDRVRDPSTHVDGSTASQQRTRTRDTTHEAAQEGARERSRSMNGAGGGKGSGSGGATGSGSGYRGGK